MGMAGFGKHKLRFYNLSLLILVNSKVLILCLQGFEPIGVWGMQVLRKLLRLLCKLQSCGGIDFESCWSLIRDIAAGDLSEGWGSKKHLTALWLQYYMIIDMKLENISLEQRISAEPNNPKPAGNQGIASSTVDPASAAVAKGHTVVSACDHNFIWGAMLLGLSLRYSNMQCPYHVLAYDLPSEDIALLSGIPGTKTFPTHKSDSRSVCTQKPLAIATADTEIIVWMDADCLAYGNLEKYFVCQDDCIQIRKRDLVENASVYRNYYSRKDRYGDIPARILNTWRKDVNDLSTPAISNSFQTNCFVINRRHLPFIEFWQKQMERVIPLETTGVYNKRSMAYSMTDESVLNSLLAFSSKAPRTSEYLMDKDPDALCLHFGLKPKPWQHWTLAAFDSYSYVQKLLDWARQEGIALPQYPESFKPENMRAEYRRARYQAFVKELRFNISSGIRGIARKLR